jgi:RecA-family ATPase
LQEAAFQNGAPSLIVFDTLARNFGAGDENNTSDMNKFVAAIDALRGAYPGCTAIVVHHTCHGDKSRARGSMVLTAAADAEYRVEKKYASVTVRNTKMKDAAPPLPMPSTSRR